MADEDRREIEGFAFVGRFFQAFAELEQRLDAALAKVLDLDDAAKLIISDNMPIQGKIGALRSIIVANFSDADGKQLEVKDAKLGVLRRVMGVNQSLRAKIAHKPFEVTGDKLVFFDASTKSGELRHTTLEIETSAFDAKLAEVRGIGEEIGSLVDGLTRYRPSLDLGDSRNAMYLAIL